MFSLKLSKRKNSIQSNKYWSTSYLWDTIVRPGNEQNLWGYCLFGFHGCYMDRNPVTMKEPPSSYTHVLPAFNPWGQQHWLNSGINAMNIYCMLISGLEQRYTSGKHSSWKMLSLSIIVRNKNKELCKFCVPNIMEKKRAGVAWEFLLGYVTVSSKAVRRGLICRAEQSN